MKNNHIFIPIDFNSFSNIYATKLDLSDYYMDYAFYGEGLEPRENMKVVFYDYSWKKDKLADEIMCLDAILKKSPNKIGSWSTELEGRIYTIVGIPKRNFCSSFIGSNTRLHEAKGQSVVQKLSSNPEEDKLDGVSCFIFPPETKIFPDFSKIIGMDIKQLNSFFQFSNINTNHSIDQKLDQLPDETFVVRGG